MNFIIFKKIMKIIPDFIKKFIKYVLSYGCVLLCIKIKEDCVENNNDNNNDTSPNQTPIISEDENNKNYNSCDDKRSNKEKKNHKVLDALETKISEEILNSK